MGVTRRVPERLELKFRDWTMREAGSAIGKAAKAGCWSYVVTPNAAHFARLHSGAAALAAIYRNADFCLLDSRVIALCVRLAGRRPPPVITGADLVAHLLAHEVTPANSICIVGGSERDILLLRRRYRLGALHHACPPMGFWQDETALDRMVDFVVDHGADFTFLCIGSPQQELLAGRIARSGRGRGVGICAGAAIDFLTGSQSRAPRALRLLALEWAWRLIKEPRRLAHRYLMESPRGIWFVLRQVGSLS